jgi:hypothetical protein
MPSHLRRYQQNRDLHFITFSCYVEIESEWTARRREQMMAGKG